MPSESVQGLSSREILSLQKKFGKNSIEKTKDFFAFSLLLSQYKNITTLILVLAAAFSFFIGDKIDFLFILLVLVLNGMFGFIQEYRAHNTLAKLKELVSPIARVIRDGKEIEIDSRDIVPGDIVVLREGDKIPADGELTTTIPLELDESILTGESIPIEKKQNDTLYSGTFMTHGRGLMKVSAIGFSTKLGKIAEEIEITKKPEIPLSKNLATLSTRIGIIAFFLSLSLIPLGLFQGHTAREAVLTSVSVAVAIIPEGLALVVTVALAVGAYRMAKRKTIIRKMAAVETLGTTNVILSDKTGTLTQNKMRVKKFSLSNKDHMDLFLRAMTLGNTANLILMEDGGSFEVAGDGTDGALLLFANENIKELKEFQKEGKVLEEMPFDTETKVIEVVWEHKGEKYVFLRGAPEAILERTKSAKKYAHNIEEYQREGLRVIAFAHKKKKDRDFTFIGFVGLYDAPRPEAKQAIQEAKDAGIKIVMVTGDNPITARSIAKEIGLISEGELVVTHDEIEKMPDEELESLLPKVKIFARMAPSDKLRLVKLYKRAGAIVAVTGDGVNDSLALSEAHIGIAMGGTGTDVAKEAADMVITDDNLYTVIKAVEEGRGIYSNIVKVVVFLLATNLTEFVLIFAAIVLGLPLPLTPTQILWINLVGDGLPAFALATDNNRHNLLKRTPRSASEQILNSKRLRGILILGGIFSAVLFTAFIYLINRGLDSDMIIFNALVIGEMIIVFVVRGGVFPLNRFLIVAVGSTLILQLIAATYLKGLFQ